MKNIILCLVNAGMLFGTWLIVSVILSTGDEWWSLYTLNMEGLSPFNAEVSWIKVFIFGSISLIISFFLVKITSEKNNFVLLQLTAAFVEQQEIVLLTVLYLASGTLTVADVLGLAVKYTVAVNK